MLVTFPLADGTFIVPNVVGLPFHVARDIATEHGVTLANPDPDGPPIGALAWPGLFYVTAQSPASGTPVSQWASVAVEVVDARGVQVTRLRA